MPRDYMYHCKNCGPMYDGDSHKEKCEYFSLPNELNKIIDRKMEQYFIDMDKLFEKYTEELLRELKDA